MLRSANALGVAPGGSSRRPAPAQASRLIACAPLQPAPAGGMRPASIGWLLRRWHSSLLAFISRPQAAPQLRPASRVASALLAITRPTTCRLRSMALSLARWAWFVARSAEIAPKQAGYPQIFPVLIARFAVFTALWVVCLIHKQIQVTKCKHDEPSGGKLGADS